MVATTAGSSICFGSGDCTRMPWMRVSLLRSRTSETNLGLASVGRKFVLYRVQPQFRGFFVLSGT